MNEVMLNGFKGRYDNPPFKMESCTQAYALLPSVLPSCHFHSPAQISRQSMKPTNLRDNGQCLHKLLAVIRLNKKGKRKMAFLTNNFIR